MKRKGRKTASGIRELKNDIEKQVQGMASRAKILVEIKGKWVAGKVEKAMVKAERAIKDETSY